MKGIFLDIGWTMCFPPSGEWMFSEKCMTFVDSAILRSIPKPRLESVFGEAKKFLDDNQLVLNEEVELERFKTFYTMLSKALPELGLTERNIQEMAEDKVYTDENYIFYEDVLPALEELKKRCKLGIISDTWPSITRVLKHEGIYKYFDSITYSCNLGVLKPDRRMYQHANQSLGLPPSETVFVDDLMGNLEGASAEGITPILIARKNNPKKVSQNKFRTISSLLELTDLEVTGSLAR